MNKKILPLILGLGLGILLIVAGVLYENLGSALAPDQLAVQTQPTVQTTAPTQSTVDTPGTAPSETTGPQLMLAPDFTVYNGEGNPVKLSDFFGKPIVLNFWASWCGPCKMEMPDFQEKYLELGQDIQFLMVNLTDGQRETVEIASSLIAGQGYTFPVFYDKDSDAVVTYGVYSIPTSYFLDAQGHLVARATGAINAETLQRGIDMIS